VARRFQILVCRGPDCGGLRRSGDVFAAFDRTLRTGEANLGGNDVLLDQWSCFGKCRSGPNVMVRETRPGESRFMLMMPQPGPGGALYSGVTPNDAKRILDEHIGAGRIVSALVYRPPTR
jgi:(2Fe-2S) ferredoxin